MGLRRWWDQSANERYWLEITDRPDIGIDLKAPQRDDEGHEFWGYSLITLLNDGDVVYHYNKTKHSIDSWSRVAGGYWEEDIVWAAHGSTARSSRVVPYLRPGWKVGLADHGPLLPPVTLDELRRHRDEILHLESALEDRFGKPLYLAFTRYAESIRTQQGYLAKLPADLVHMLPQIEKAARLADSLSSSPPRRDLAKSDRSLGSAYREADEEASVSERDPMMPDPALIERGTRGHARAQNILAKSLAGRGVEPISPSPGEPQYDLAWIDGNATFVAEIKSLTIANEERQLRLALGQVLRYADLLRASSRRVVPVIMAEREPADPSWNALCSSLGVILLWPQTIERLGREHAIT